MQAAAYEGPKRDILIDVGTADSFLENQLKPDDFSKAAAGNKALALQLRKQARPHLRFFYDLVVVLPWLAYFLPVRLALALTCGTVRAFCGADMHKCCWRAGLEVVRLLMPHFSA